MNRLNWHFLLCDSADSFYALTLFYIERLVNFRNRQAQETTWKYWPNVQHLNIKNVFSSSNNIFPHLLLQQEKKKLKFWKDSNFVDHCNLHQFAWGEPMGTKTTWPDNESLPHTLHTILHSYINTFTKLTHTHTPNFYNSMSIGFKRGPKIRSVRKVNSASTWVDEQWLKQKTIKVNYLHDFEIVSMLGTWVCKCMRAFGKVTVSFHSCSRQYHFPYPRFSFLILS